MRALIVACVLAIMLPAHADQVIVGIMDDAGGRETGATVYMPPAEYKRYHAWLVVRQTETGDAPDMQIGRWDMWPGRGLECRKQFGVWH